MVAAAIDVDKGGAVLERRGCGRERRLRLVPRGDIMRARPGRDRPHHMGIGPLGKHPRKARSAPFGDAQAQAHAGCGARPRIEMDEDVRESHGRSPVRAPA